MSRNQRNEWNSFWCSFLLPQTAKYMQQQALSLTRPVSWQESECPLCSQCHNWHFWVSAASRVSRWALARLFNLKGSIRLSKLRYLAALYLLWFKSYQGFKVHRKANVTQVGLCHFQSRNIGVHSNVTSLTTCKLLPQTLTTVVVALLWSQESHLYNR